jgi:uncharacterized protein (DUF2267 family)
VDYQGFISTVQEGAHIPPDEAERAACATLQTLAERISPGEAEDIAERLPGELQSCLEPGPAESFHVDEFLRRIGERVGVDRTGAERDAKAVFAALSAAVGPDEIADIRSELPKDFDPLIDEALVRAPHPPIPAEPALSYDEFLERVAERANLDRGRAQRATDAVLEVLATRVTGGQVEDLEWRLPVELHAALERGRAEIGRPRPLSVEAFVADVAKREDVDKGQAAEHARAVFATLREAVGEQEWHDTAEQLPGEYRMLLSR